MDPVPLSTTLTQSPTLSESRCISLNTVITPTTPPSCFSTLNPPTKLSIDLSTPAETGLTAALHAPRSWQRDSYSLTPPEQKEERNQAFAEDAFA